MPMEVGPPRRSGANVTDSTSTTRYVPLNRTNENSEVTPSKVMVIQNLSVTIKQDLKDNFEFKIDSEFGILSDNKTIPKVDLTCKEDIVFDDRITLEKIKSVIRRCGILEYYKQFFTNDPEIVINSYTLNVQKDYQFFDEFKEGVLIAEEIFE